MFLKNSLVFFMWSFCVFCESRFVNNLPKCKLDDDDCFKDLHRGLIRDIGKTGVPEFNIPPVDPMRIKNVSINIMDAVNITLVDGVVKGLKDCNYDKSSMNVIEGRGYEEVTCDITIKGRYKIETTGRFFKNILGGKAIHGEGNGKVKIEKLNLKIDYPFFVQKRSDGEIYLNFLYDLIKYSFTIKGNTVFVADNIFLDNLELSKVLINILNNNSGFIMTEFGQPFIVKAMKEFYFKFSEYFYGSVPARYYIIDDLTPYVKP